MENTDKKAIIEQKKAAHAAEQAKKASELKAKVAKAEKDKRKFSLKKYAKDTVSEFKKVVWPKRIEVVRSTGVVLACIIGVAVAVFALDTLFNFILRLALQINGA